MKTDYTIKVTATLSPETHKAFGDLTMSSINAVIRTMPEADRFALRAEIDAGNVEAVTAIFERAGIENARAVASDFIAARATSRANPVECVAIEPTVYQDLFDRRPICSSFDPALDPAYDGREEYRPCVRCLWSRRAHEPKGTGERS